MDVVRGGVCAHSQHILDGRGVFASDKEGFRSNPDGLQGRTTQYDTKKAVQTVWDGCGSRLKVTLVREDGGVNPCLFSYLSYKEDIGKK